MTDQTARTLTPLEHDRAWHAIEHAAGQDDADPGTVLNAVLNALRITAPTVEDEQAASTRRKTAAGVRDAARQASGQQPAAEATHPEPQDHPGAELYAQLRRAGNDHETAQQLIYAHARMTIRQHQALNDDAPAVGVQDATQPTTNETEQLVHVGWWCWRGDNHGHLATQACRSDNVPIHVPAEWADDMRAVISRIEDGDEDDTAAGAES